MFVYYDWIFGYCLKLEFYNNGIKIICIKGICKILKKINKLKVDINLVNL